MSAHLLATALISFIVSVFFCYQIYVFFKEESRRKQNLKQHKKQLKHHTPHNRIESFIKEIE